MTPDLARLKSSIEAEFAKAPPTICVIGLSGVGKSSTINAMFGTKKAVSASTRGTHRFRADTFDIPSARVEGMTLGCSLKVIDAPGLGEDVTLDEGYLKSYRTHLPKCDVALWVVAARNRALALDQQYIKALSKVLPHGVIGINQTDLIDPLDWDERINMPSASQDKVLKEIAVDRAEKLGRLFPNRPKTIVFSARHFWNLQALFTAVIESAPPQRRWMFDLVKSFSTTDWLARAKGLTDAQRKILAERYMSADKAMPAASLKR